MFIRRKLQLLRFTFPGSRLILCTSQSFADKQEAIYVQPTLLCESMTQGILWVQHAHNASERQQSRRTNIPAHLTRTEMKNNVWK